MTIFSKAAEKMSARMEELANKTVALADRVSPEVRQARLDLCLSCDKLYKPTTTCKLCGCFMKLKTWMPREFCPMKKWDVAEPNKENKE